jgi:hypothetical protein
LQWLKVQLLVSCLTPHSIPQSNILTLHLVHMIIQVWSNHLTHSTPYFLSSIATNQEWMFLMISCSNSQCLKWKRLFIEWPYLFFIWGLWYCMSMTLRLSLWFLLLILFNSYLNCLLLLFIEIVPDWSLMTCTASWLSITNYASWILSLFIQ